MLPYNFLPAASEKMLTTYLTLRQYPILCGRIRSRMRKQMYSMGILQRDFFEDEVRQAALQSQQREGLRNPFQEESNDVWELRICAMRDQLTDYYFSMHMTPHDLEEIIAHVLQEKGVEARDSLLTINPELAPQDLVLEQAMIIEKMPAAERGHLIARLSELKVVLIRSLISDQLRYINVAREWLTINDLFEIRRHKIGNGRIGGKAAGMLLAYRIMQSIGEEAIKQSITIPETYYLGSDIFYSFMEINNLLGWNDQKYKPEDQMRAEFPQIAREFEFGAFPTEVIDRLESILLRLGKKPIIVRSSSLLEDNFGTSFAGKYDSFFLPNQGNLEENLSELTKAIARIYSSTLNPNALLYRRGKGLQDYDERMAILMQVVQGEQQGRYFFPLAAGVAFSKNLYRWAPQIQREAGFIRLVWGMGTRAVDRVGNDYPRLVALSHPLLRPNSSPDAIRRYSQQHIDVVDLESNQFVTLPVSDVLDGQYEHLRYVAQLDQDGYLSSLRSNVVEGSMCDLVITMEDFLKRTPFAETMRQVLRNLELRYQAAVDLEFTASIQPDQEGKPGLEICLLQCRPQSQLEIAAHVQIPAYIQEEDIIFSTEFMVPEGLITDIQYVLYVPPEAYYSMPTQQMRMDLCRAIGLMNKHLAQDVFICVGPGRWGTSNSDLGVSVSYGDIYNSRALVEVTGAGYGNAPEPSFGTHFFQDLLESQIYPLAIYLDHGETSFNNKFFDGLPNHLLAFLPDQAAMEPYLRVISVNDYRSENRLVLAMDDIKGKAVAYIKPVTLP